MVLKLNSTGNGLVGRRTALALGVACFLAPLSAYAAGRIVWKRKTIREGSDSWLVRIEVHLDRAPDIALMPVRFSFTPVTYYERSLVDGREGPVLRKVPLREQQPIIESVDVGFMDPGSGKPARRTRFDFRITRDRGFTAGEYDVVVTDSRSGQKMSGPVRLVLQGENEVVDRRSIVFDEGKKKEKSAPAAAADTKPRERELTPQDDAYWAGGTQAPAEPDAPLPPPAHLQEKPGCGCRVAGAGGSPSVVALGMLPLALLLRRRGRRA